MALVVTDNRYYSEIAAAIREKNGLTDLYTPAQMAEAIRAIELGGFFPSILVTGLSKSDTVTATKDGVTMLGVWNSTESRFDITKIKELGTWTVTATNGAKTITQDVLVDAAVEFEIEMSYTLWLYRAGDECVDVTGGWSNSGYSNRGGTKNETNFFNTFK